MHAKIYKISGEKKAYSKRSFFILLLLVALFSFLNPGLAEPPAQPVPETQDFYWNELSRFLAGLPVPENSGFFKLTKTGSYKKHLAFIDKFWKSVEKKTLIPFREWKGNNIPAGNSSSLVFYPLSGADFINMYLIYPDSNQYLMVALEDAGPIIEPLKEGNKKLSSGLASIRRYIYQFGLFNYFLSRTMKEETSNRDFAGTGTILMIFMARLGLSVEKVEYIKVDNTGSIIPVLLQELLKKKNKSITGVRIYFKSPGDTAPKSVIYLNTRLTKESVSNDSPMGKFLNSQQNMKTVMKSAVYLLHMRKYEKLKDFILEKSDIIIQDDSGVPYNDFVKKQWEVNLFGKYKPIPVTGCIYNYQVDLSKAYRKNKTVRLPFRFGYGGIQNHNNSNIIIARKKP